MQNAPAQTRRKQYGKAVESFQVGPDGDHEVELREDPVYQYSLETGSPWVTQHRMISRLNTEISSIAEPRPDMTWPVKADP